MRLLLDSTSTSSSTHPPPPPSPAPLPIDSDIVVILAALLCALICVVGLSLVVRCAFLRRHQAQSSLLSKPVRPKGLNKKSLQSLPTLSFSSASRQTECAICLGEFSEGELVRVLPPCGHGFHVSCIDKWLGDHPSCPSCRTVLIVPVTVQPSKCCKCGESTSNGAPSVKISNGDEGSCPGVAV